MMGERDAKRVSQDACIAVLAAGASRRMGTPKQLAPFDGVSLVRRACLQAIAACQGEVCVVTGAYAECVAAEIADLDVGIVKNDAWETGQASSVRAAVEHCIDEGIACLTVFPVDMPLVDAGHLTNLIDAVLVEGADASASEGPEGPMAPCAFSRTMFSVLGDLEGDKGALRVVRDPAFRANIRVVDFPDAAMAMDVDTPDDLRRIEDAARKAHAFQFDSTRQGG